MYSAGALTILKHDEVCSNCELPIVAGSEALWMHYYGQRPTQYAHWAPTCKEVVDQVLRLAGLDPDEVGKRMERAAREALARAGERVEA